MAARNRWSREPLGGIDDVKIADLRTPCLLLDEGRLDANIDRVNRKATSLGVALRPHFKTPKCLPILERMTACAKVAGVTVSTLREAEYLARVGYSDLLLTTPLSPRRLGDVSTLTQSGTRLTLVVDSLACVEAAIEAAEADSLDLEVLLEVDVDGFRSGLPLAGGAFIKALGRLARNTCVSVRGVMVYPGASSRLPDEVGRRALGERHRIACLQAAHLVQSAGFSAEVRSFGSTSVLMAMTDLTGVTEHRGGIYVFQDLHQAGVGWCSRDDIALTVAATVVSHDMARNRLYIDAGALALSKDRSTAGFDFEAQYGWLVDPRSHEPLGDLWVERVFQEHGVVASATEAAIPFERLPVGAVIAVQVNHADISAAAYPSYNVVRGGEVVDRWDRVNGW